MWQNFTERGKRVFTQAHKEALRLGHGVVGTEHILLALLSDNDGVVNQILSSFNVDTSLLRAETEHFANPGEPANETIDLPSSSRAKLVVELSMREARKMGVNYIGTEHILLGILAEGEGMAAQLLASHGIDLESCRQAVRNITGGATPEPPER